MSADGTAKVLAKMLDSDEFTKRVAKEPEKALASDDVTEDERAMLSNAASEGVEKLVNPKRKPGERFQPPGKGGKGPGESPGKADASGVSSLAGYLNGATLSAEIQKTLNQALDRRFDLNLIGEHPVL